jgi:hypothetical protein
MATPSEALAALQTELASQPLEVRIEVLKRLVRELEERRRDNQEQRIQAELTAVKALPSAADLRLADTRGLLEQLQEAAGKP